MIIHPSSVCFDKQFHFILVILKRRKVSYYTNTTISLCGSGIQRSRLCRYTETRRSAYRFSIDAMALTADNVTGKTAGPENLTFHYVYSCLWLPLEHRETPDPPIHPRCADGRYPPGQQHLVDSGHHGAVIQDFEIPAEYAALDFEMPVVALHRQAVAEQGEILF